MISSYANTFTITQQNDSSNSPLGIDFVQELNALWNILVNKNLELCGLKKDLNLYLLS
ncbi:1301_t:CDS:2 [Funneliformis caledonium]|uniref:1301_t:CDS:1 n=1 Tax=Funneliformis caledonium TaxID=1117310 RepID=A0A9N8ZNZ3_9GLOM|nr:1301_t:CDS:2 [Funneliformis caledonium]